MKIGPLNIPLKEDFSLKSILGFEKTPVNMLLAVSVIAMLAMLILGIGNYLIHSLLRCAKRPRKARRG